MLGLGPTCDAWYCDAFMLLLGLADGTGWWWVGGGVALLALTAILHKAA